MYALAETSQMTAQGFTNSTGSVVGVTVTASGTVHNEGTFTDITTSTTVDCQMLGVAIWNGSTAFRGLLDIALHTTNEDVVIENILVDFNRPDEHAYWHLFPVHAPAGTGISARLRANVTPASVSVAVVCQQVTTQDDQYLATVETIGTDTTAGAGASGGTLDSGGSQIDPGGSAGTFGAWKELTAATSYPCYAAKIILGNISNSAYGAGTIMAWHVQVGIGASGDEQVVWDRIGITGDNSNDTFYPTEADIPLVAPAGSRICVRANCNSTDATDRLIQCAMYLFGKTS